MKNSILLLLLPMLLACNQGNKSVAATLEAPTDVVARAVSPTEALLSWTDNAADGKGYYVFEALGQPVASLPARSTSYTFRGLEPEHTYSFSVQAFGEDGRLSLKVTAAPLTLPAVEPEPGPDDAIRFDWTAVTAGALPEGIRLYKTSGQVEGRPLIAWYAIADPKEVAVRVLYPGGGKKATIDQQAEAD